MSDRLWAARRRFHSWLSPEQQRGIRVLTWASIICLIGVTLTGVWQFFAHESSSSWFGYQPGSEMRVGSSPSGRVAEWHSIFGAAAAVIALVGGGWVAYKVVFDIPRAALISFAVTVFGLISGSVIRYNIVKREGLTYEEADRGYLQIFRGDLEFVVTDRFELGPLAIRLWTASHVLTVPIIVAVIWLGLSPSDDSDTGSPA